jgi:protein subunit release factor A
MNVFLSPMKFCKLRMVARLLVTRETVKLVGNGSKTNKRGSASTDIKVNAADIIETVAYGGGPGGQAVNKTRNAIRLHHLPTGITIRNHETRDLQQNRKLAHKVLLEKLDAIQNGSLAKVAVKAARIRKQKAKRENRSREKYGSTTTVT